MSLTTDKNRDGTFEEWSLQQRVKLVFANSLPTNLATIFLAPLITLLLYDKVPVKYLWSWCVVMIVLAIIRLSIKLAYEKNPSSVTAETWAKRYELSSFLIGCGWAVIAWFFYLISESMVMALLFMVFTGIIAAALMALSALPRAFYLFIAPPLIAMYISLYFSKDDYSAYIALGLLPYFLTIFLISTNTHKYILSSLKYQYDRKLLAVSLRREIEQRKKAQRALELQQVDLEVQVNERTQLIQKTNRDLSREILNRKQAEEELKHIAHHDVLTKLPNRLLLMATLEQAMKRANRSETIVAILFIDLNGFKKINDSYGHSVGDKVLQSVANVLTQTLREEDTISRIGGDEFIVVTEQENAHESASVLAEKIISALSQTFIINDQEFAMGCSIGISLYPQDGNSVDELLRNADTAMYKSKQDSDKRYTFYSE